MIAGVGNLFDNGGKGGDYRRARQLLWRRSDVRNMGVCVYLAPIYGQKGWDHRRCTSWTRMVQSHSERGVLFGEAIDRAHAVFLSAALQAAVASPSVSRATAQTGGERRRSIRRRRP